MEAFRRYDQSGSGFISALDFQDIMVSIKSHLLTPEVKANLVAAAGGGQMGKRVSFPYFMAFNSLLNNMELIKRIYLNATSGIRNQEVTKGIKLLKWYHVSLNIFSVKCIIIKGKPGEVK